MYSEFFKRDLTDQEVEDLREFTAGAKPGDSKEFFGVVMQCEGIHNSSCIKCVFFDCDDQFCFECIECLRNQSSDVIFTVKQ